MEMAAPSQELPSTLVTRAPMIPMVDSNEAVGNADARLVMVLTMRMVSSGFDF